MPGILHLSNISRRRVLQVGAGALVTAISGARTALGRQPNGPEFTFVVAGLDYREGFDEHNNDTLMVSRVNTDLGTVRTVSIPRDLYVEIPGYGFDKITRAFHHGYYTNAESWDAGAETLVTTISHNFGVVIDGIATTDFAGFRRLIEAVDGLEINNPYEVVDPIWEPEFPGQWSWPAGQLTLEPESALNFVRTRNMDGDDGRVMRQQLVIDAFLQELKHPESVTKIPEIVDSARDAVGTDIPLDLQALLIAAIPTIERENVQFTSLVTYLWGGTLDNGMWVYQGDWSVLPGVLQSYLAGE